MYINIELVRILGLLGNVFGGEGLLPYIGRQTRCIEVPENVHLQCCVYLYQLELRITFYLQILTNTDNSNLVYSNFQWIDITKQYGGNQKSILKSRYSMDQGQMSSYLINSTKFTNLYNIKCHDRLWLLQFLASWVKHF